MSLIPSAKDLASAIGAELKSAGVPAAEEVIQNAVQKVLGGQSLEAYLDSRKIVITFEPKEKA